MDKKIKYVIITPVRNEEEYIEKTINSVISQTIRPIEWIIVDDGSTDNTAMIIDEYANQYGWIKTIHRHDRGFRKAGGGVIEAFYDAFNNLQFKEWDFIVKLDGDLTFSDTYFEKCFENFKKNQKLGICGGGIYNIIDGRMIYERDPIFHVRGATKIYRAKCWDDIGGLLKAPGWDTLDEVKANMNGWETRSYPELKISHHRSTGVADGTWGNWTKNGRANYISGYHPLFMILKCIKRIFQKPYFIVSIALMWGYVNGYIIKIPQVDDKDLIAYLRKQQLNKLFFRQSIWKYK
ncbi:glycosyl transferase family 2 [Candidatus Scalindua japonica]|uniref:Glycosyl transferase family 2 n=1 Tax=Candidatus Scalindua japonica TaxID=1284222 RepID=A0A286TZD1_9BACT|nr:glycosyltransferase family A protein [Candidatus Scalindua japonica]GAX61234.1 glycosyl transferase family 2 [Candidatus Scalindua japonica]